MVHSPSRALRLAAAGLAPLILGVALLGALATTAQAQAAAGTVNGRVIDSKSSRPLGEATVRVDGQAATARTNVRGVFTLTGLTGSTVKLTVSRIGYQPAAATVTVGATTVVDILLSESLVKLDELVVTGQAGETQKRALGNVIGQLNLGDAQLAAPSKGIQEALSVAVPGLQIQRASGQLGTGGVTRIRGVSSLSLSAEPIIFIDGVRMDNTAGSNSVGFSGGGDRPSRVNDIDPNDIESIQVLKGPSAATLYGTEAANGVIQIITKRGAVGRPVWSTEFRAGTNWLRKAASLYEGVYYRDTAGNVQRLNVIENDIARGFGSPFSTGVPIGGQIAVAGGTDAIKYRFSGSYDRDEGILSYNYQKKGNAVANLTYTASSKLQVDLNLGYTRSNTRSASATQPLSTYMVWACPNNSCNFPGLGAADAGRGYLAGVTPEAFNEIEGFDDIDRTRAGFTVRHTPLKWLTHRLTAGGDFTNNASSNLYPRGSNISFGFPTGAKFVQNDRSTFLTLDYSVTGTANLGKSLSSSTSGGVQYYSKKFTQVAGNGQGFPIRGVNTVSGGGVRQGSEDPNFNLQNKTLGVYVQEQIGWKNRIFLTAAVRGDDNSAFGTNYKFVTYPKFSGAWVLSEEPFFGKSNTLSSLKLRSAWGKAGQQPNVFAASQTYGPSVGGGGVPTVTPVNLGNPDLQPEVAREIEGGFDLGLFNNRVSVEATYYDKVTKDGILTAPVSPSVGFPGTQFINVGQFSNKGFEIAVDATVLESKDWRVGLRGSYSRNSNKIDNLGQDTPLANGGFGATFGAYNVTGFPIGSIFYQQVVSATLTAPGSVTNLQCKGGTDLGNADGTTVPCAGAPRVFAGQPIPKWLSAVSADIGWKRFRLAAVAEFQGGNVIIDGNEAGSHFFFNNSRAAVEGTDPILVAYATQLPGAAFTALGIQNGGFGKLRNLSLTYQLPRGVTDVLGAGQGSVTLTGANLFTLWRGSQGVFGSKLIDPETRINNAGFFNDPNATANYNQESFPQFQRFLATVRLAF